MKSIAAFSQLVILANQFFSKSQRHSTMPFVAGKKEKKKNSDESERGWFFWSGQTPRSASSAKSDVPTGAHRIDNFLPRLTVSPFTCAVMEYQLMRANVTPASFRAIHVPAAGFRDGGKHCTSADYSLRRAAGQRWRVSFSSRFIARA